MNIHMCIYGTCIFVYVFAFVAAYHHVQQHFRTCLRTRMCLRTRTGLKQHAVRERSVTLAARIERRAIYGNFNTAVSCWSRRLND